MSRFLTDLEVRLVSESKGRWALTTPLRYESDVLGVIGVPTGFETDFASVPRAPLVYSLLGDTAHAAATIHDFLYATGGVTRAEADYVLREAALASGVSLLRAWTMWVAVRLFGFTRWNK